jgi:hypothetical protein
MNKSENTINARNSLILDIQKHTERVFNAIQIKDEGYEEIKITPLTQSPVFSYFDKPVTNVIPKKECSLIEIYHLIKGVEFSEQTKQLWNLSDPVAARKFKAANFDYVTFSGVFSRRQDTGLIKHSGLITIDFDHLKNPALLKSTLLKDNLFDTELLFTSPSGHGLKWVIQTDLTQVCHQDYFKAVANYIKHTYNLDIDLSGKDVSRACFVPHDPEVYIHPKYLL